MIATGGCEGEPGRGLGPAGLVAILGSVGDWDAMKPGPAGEESERRPLFDLASHPRLRQLFGRRVMSWLNHDTRPFIYKPASLSETDMEFMGSRMSHITISITY